eukprot:CAMPEP_0170646562 /NCGR_PEP_ID=MMETSP0224-20130122/43708_1 /TAXON_ID=285029 /ORGANISM="Togula jolla, Strain CCCM 725" /LENGTH=32 /DNA_ID= /DNA_START= /DNA_END= /DNA_ORIENTATION=
MTSSSCASCVSREQQMQLRAIGMHLWLRRELL